MASEPPSHTRRKPDAVAGAPPGPVEWRECDLFSALETFDIAGPDITDYAGLLAGTAAALGLHRRSFSVRLFSPGLSTLWVCLITGAPRELVAPLVQSLRHRMVAKDRRLQEALGVPGLSLPAALRTALTRNPSKLPTPSRPSRSLTLAARRGGAAHDVRSVQRLPLPPGWTAAAVAEEYQRWLPRFFRPLMRVEANAAGVCRFLVRGLRRPLLVLEPGTGALNGDALVWPPPRPAGRGRRAGPGGDRSRRGR